jgi:hypothetical protein
MYLSKLAIHLIFTSILYYFLIIIPISKERGPKLREIK